MNKKYIVCIIILSILLSGCFIQKKEKDEQRIFTATSNVEYQRIDNNLVGKIELTIKEWTTGISVNPECLNGNVIYKSQEQNKFFYDFNIQKLPKEEATRVNFHLIENNKEVGIVPIYIK